VLPLTASLPGAPALTPRGDPSPSQATLVFDMLELLAARVALENYLPILVVNHNSPAQCADRLSGARR